MSEQRSRRRLVRPLPDGHVPIPEEFRRQLGIDADTVLAITVEDGELRLTPLRDTGQTAGSPWLRELYDMFAPVRDEASRYSEDEINAAIDQAVKAVRQKRAEGRP
jgi:bifunctional DNA-binding transcriptional regulator/antitoxin component of YhaV-PrlF toxin-antitoxin module